jgi:hypothetical protein
VLQNKDKKDEEEKCDSKRKKIKLTHKPRTLKIDV